MFTVACEEWVSFGCIWLYLSFDIAVAGRHISRDKKGVSATVPAAAS